MNQAHSVPASQVLAEPLAETVSAPVDASAGATPAGAPEPANAEGEKTGAKSSEDQSREVEVKFVTDPAGLAAALASPQLRASGATGPARKLTSIYFDTPEFDLQKRRIALRVRRDGRKTPVMALKWSPAGEGAFSRGEIEFPVTKLQPDLTLCQGEIGELARGLVGDKPLEAKYETRVSRTLRLLSHGATKIEVAFDQGQIVAGDLSKPLCEVELELKSGEARDLYEFAALLSESLPLQFDVTSKAERAWRLATGVLSTPVKIKPVALAPELMLDEAIARIVVSNCDHFVANFAPLRDSDDPESIHQMRVALRRLRAALAMFKRAIPCSEFELFRAEARDLATAMGPARDSDALRELIEDGPLAHLGDKKNFTGLLEELEARRVEAYRDARAMLESPRVTGFVLRLSAFVARRGWRNAVSGPQLGSLTEPVVIFANEALERLYKRVLRRGKDLASLPDEQRHQARIALKNLRYGAEFFAPCFQREAAGFIRPMAVLQNLLGAHNDAASAEHFLSLPHDAETARAAGVVTGWFARGSLVADEKLTKTWKNFKQARPFWR